MCLAAAPIPKNQRPEHALNRLTFGARPGDLERVAALGVKKWIDLQLHPERIPENPVLGAKLRPLDTLTMSTARMLQDYPSPQQVKEMVAGRLPFPDDPDKRMMVDRLAARLKGKADGDGGQRTCGGTGRAARCAATPHSARGHGSGKARSVWIVPASAPGPAAGEHGTGHADAVIRGGCGRNCDAASRAPTDRRAWWRRT